MSQPRICPECGSDIYRAANYDELAEARDRHYQKNKEQAIEILRLQLRVTELEEERRTRSRKVEMQRRTIVRLQDKLRGKGIAPHADKHPGEGDPASLAGKVSLAPPVERGDLFMASPRGMRLLRRNREKARGQE